MYSLTIFESIYDNKTHRKLAFDDWNAFETFLYRLSKIPYKSKKEAKLISPASYIPDCTRANDNVVDWGGWAALDIDKHDFKGDLEKELKEKYGNYYYVCYSTASSSAVCPKFRLVFPLQGRVTSDKIRKFWYALNKEFGELGDAQTKDLSRMYYIPGNYYGANNFIFTNNGNYINPDEFMTKHPMPEKKAGLYSKFPESIQKALIAHKQNSLTNRDISWNGYEDCPFLNKTMIDEFKRIAFTDNSGRYSMVYNIMVSIAARAIKMGYPISSFEVIELVRELDMDTANRYAKRKLDVEAARAIEFAMNGI